MSFVGAKPPPCIKLGQPTYNSAQLSGPVFGEWPLRVKLRRTSTVRSTAGPPPTTDVFTDGRHSRSVP